MERGHKVLICDVLACNEADIKDIKENSGMTNKSYTFVVRGQKYLIRIKLLLSQLLRLRLLVMNDIWKLLISQKLDRIEMTI